MLYNWAENDEKAKNPRKENGALHCPSKPRFSVDEKINAVKRCFEGKESVESVAREIGCSNVTIYNWRNKYIREGVFSPMDENRKKRTQNVVDSNDVDQLKQQLYELQMEVDIRKETLNVIKKDPGVNWKNLKNREKVAVIDAMKEKYPLLILLRKDGTVKE